MSGLSACCAEGVIHSGDPKGSIETIAGVKTYVAKPASYDSKKAVIFLTDVFGLELNNNKLLADSFAKAGFQTYLPDYLIGDPVTDDMMNTPDRMAVIGKWRTNHGPEQTLPPLLKVVEELKKQGVERFGATAYCFGAPYAITLAEKGLAHAAALAHPSMLESEKDLPRIKATGVPFLWNTCEVDQQWPQEKQKEADEFFKGDEKYKRTYSPGCTHGFAVRGDMSVPEVKAGKELAFNETVAWFKNHL